MLKRPTPGSLSILRRGLGVDFVALLFTVALLLICVQTAQSAEVDPNFDTKGASAANKFANARERGIEAFEKNDVRRGYELLLPLSRAGDPAGKFYVAVVLARPYFQKATGSTGIFAEKNYEGLPVNLLKGLALLRAAAAAKYPSALSSLAMLYRAGSGVPKDIDRSVQLMKEAANLGEVGAYHVLGMHYLKSAPATSFKWQYLFYNCGNYPAAEKPAIWQFMQSFWFPGNTATSEISIAGQKLIDTWAARHGKLCPSQAG